MKKLLLTLVLILVYSCNQEPTTPDKKIVKPETEINDLVRNAGELAPQPQYFSDDPTPQTKDTTAEVGGESYKSKSEKWIITNKFDEIVAFNSFADVLYPGAIVQGKDIAVGKLTSIGDFSREPITLTLQGGQSIKVNNPNLSSVTDGVNQLIKYSTPTAAQMVYTKSELYSSNQAFLKLGLDINWLMGNFTSKFQKDDNIKKKSIFLYFKQIYYTISVNSFSSPADYFSSDVNLTKLNSRIYPGNPACYLSSVSYGRIIIVKMTSTESYEEMLSAIEGSWLLVDGKLQYKYSNILKNSTFEAVIVGGSAQGAANALTNGTLEGINELILKEATFSSSNPGYPISFQVRYLNNGSPVQLGSSTEYWKQNWIKDESKYQKFDFYLDKFNIIDDGNTWPYEGKFYYTIQVKDKNGNVLKDANGKDVSIITKREEYIEKEDGEYISINKQFYGVSLKKEFGEQFIVSAELSDRFESIADKIAGSQGFIYEYPWNYYFSDFITMDLVPNEGSYDTQFVFKVVKK